MVNEEERRAKFKALAEKRVNKTISLIKLIGNLSRKSAYKYDDNDIAKMKKAINKELNNTWSKFNSGSHPSDTDKFSL